MDLEGTFIVAFNSIASTVLSGGSGYSNPYMGGSLDFWSPHLQARSSFVIPVSGSELFSQSFY